MEPAGAGRLTFDIHPAAGPVLRKRGDPDRLFREQTALRAGAGTGVVALVDCEGPPGAPTELVLAAVTGEPLSSARLGPTDVAPIMAHVAATVARLHGAGVVHGALRAEHVILSPQRPVLCGFGHAALRSSLDDRDHEWVAATAADVLDLGQLVHESLATLDGTDAVLGHALRRVVERTTRPEPAERPRAAEVATSLQHLAPTAAPAAVGDDASNRLRARVHALVRGEVEPAVRRRRLVTGALAIGAAVLAVVAGPTFARSRSGPEAPPPPAEAPTTIAPTTTTAPTMKGERVWPAECGERCSSPVIHHGGAAYVAGEPGDLALVVDAGCDGRLDPVVVRPATGAVFVFEGWPGPEQSVTAEPAARFPMAVTGVEPIDLDGDGCHELVGTSSAGPLPLRFGEPAR